MTALGCAFHGEGKLRLYFKKRRASRADNQASSILWAPPRNTASSPRVLANRREHLPNHRIILIQPFAVINCGIAS